MVMLFLKNNKNKNLQLSKECTKGLWTLAFVPVKFGVIALHRFQDDLLAPAVYRSAHHKQVTFVPNASHAQFWFRHIGGVAPWVRVSVVIFHSIEGSA